MQLDGLELLGHLAVHRVVVRWGFLNEADMNQDGFVNFLDTSPFIVAFSSQ